MGKHTLKGKIVMNLPVLLSNYKESFDILLLKIYWIIIEVSLVTLK